jgi:hypothetical protein
MKKLFFIILVAMTTGLISCGNDSEKTPAVKDSVSSGSSNAIDSAANNGILPPSAAPGNAGNSSLADTTYKKTKDSLKK